MDGAVLCARGVDFVNMMHAQQSETRRDVLLCHAQPAEGPAWLRGVDAAMRPAGFMFIRAHCGADTIERVERGGLTAAVLIADQVHIDALSLLRIIRSIDLVLPCCLLTRDTSRRFLETALSLRVNSVIAYPVELDELALGLQKLVADQS